MAHDAGVSASDVEAGQTASLRAFVGRLCGARLWATLAERCLRVALPGAVVLLLLAMGFPTAAAWAALGLTLWLGAVALQVARRQRQARRAAVLAWRRLGVAQADLLLAWEEADARGGGGQPMVRWLSEDLSRYVASLPAAALPRFSPARLGRLRYLVPLCMGLLLALLLQPEFGYWPAGVQSSGGAAGVGGGGAGGDGGQGGASPPDPESPPKPRVEEQPPAPMPDAGVDRSVVAPEFVGDGPSRRALAERALVGMGDQSDPAGAQAGADAAASQTSGGVGADGSSLALPSERLSPEDFARAEERARASRRIPPRERAVVREFFRRLQEGQ